MKREIAIAGAAWLALVAMPAGAQERTAVKAGFELPAGSGKTILVFRPTVSVGAQSTGGLFEPNGDWTEQARRNIEAALTEQQQRIGNRVVAAPESYGADAQLVEEYAALFAAVSQSVIDYQFFVGERLNEITWYAGIAPDEPLIRETSRKHKPLPRLKRATLLAEIPELLEATYRTERSVADFQLTSAKPDPFLGQPGIRFTYAYVDNDHLPRRGEARATLVDGRLYLATFDAPRQHFFDRSLGDFRALTDAATLS
jgi:hypothetical protein